MCHARSGQKREFESGGHLMPWIEGSVLMVGIKHRVSGADGVAANRPEGTHERLSGFLRGPAR